MARNERFVRYAPRLEDAHGTHLTPGDKLELRVGDETCTGTLTVEEVYVVRLDQPTSDGVVTQTLSHRPNERLKEQNARRLDG